MAGVRQFGRRPKRVTRRKAVRRRMVMYRRPRQLTRTFTEVFDAGQWAPNTGKIFSVAMQDIPQAPFYASLYKQFCIRKFTAIIVPSWTSSDVGAVGATPMARLAYAVADTPINVTPATELSVLTENSSNIVLLDRIRKLTCRPKPDLTSQTIAGVPVATSQKAPVWLNFNNPSVANPGNSVYHDGIQAFFTVAGPTPTPVQLYYKVTFSVRDPS